MLALPCCASWGVRAGRTGGALRGRIFVIICFAVGALLALASQASCSVRATVAAECQPDGWTYISNVQCGLSTCIIYLRSRKGDNCNHLRLVSYKLNLMMKLIIAIYHTRNATPIYIHGHTRIWSCMHGLYTRAHECSTPRIHCKRIDHPPI